MFPTSADFVAWAFPDLDLGDTRRDRRFALVAQAALEHPQESLPDKFRDPAGYVACLRLLHNEAVTHESILSCHQVAVLDRLEQHGPQVVLFIHDTTDLDYSGHATLSDELGQIGNGGGQGFLCHNSLAVDPHSREILGLVNQILHCRPHVDKDESVAAKRERDSRESRLWLRGVDAIGPAPADKLWVDVCDRGADVFEFLQGLMDRRRHFVVRSSYNRALVVPPVATAASAVATGAAVAVEDGLLDPSGGVGSSPAPHLLHDFMRTLPATATWAVEVGATKTRQARTARVRACACLVTLKPPHVRKGEYRREPVRLWAIRVWEESPPAGEEGLEWVLLTDQDVSVPARLREVVGWYECRVVVEEYHKGQKTGVGIEKLQLQDAQSLRAAIALMSVVAIPLVNLRIAARDADRATEPAVKHVPALWVRVLSIWCYKEVRDMTVLEFTLALARLGGHLNRKSDGLPGWITLWRGWERLHTMIDYELSREACV